MANFLRSEAAQTSTSPGVHNGVPAAAQAGPAKVRLPSAVRPRRLRTSPALRAMVRETQLAADDLIYPLFVTHGQQMRRPIGSGDAQTCCIGSPGSASSSPPGYPSTTLNECPHLNQRLRRRKVGNTTSA